MALLTVQTTAIGGLDTTYAAASVGGDSFVNDGHTVLAITNSGGGPCTVTVQSVVLCNQGFEHDAVAVVPAGQSWLMGPFSVQRFNAGSAQCSVTYSQVSSVTVAAVKVPS